MCRRGKFDGTKKSGGVWIGHFAAALEISQVLLTDEVYVPPIRGIRVLQFPPIKDGKLSLLSNVFGMSSAGQEKEMGEHRYSRLKKGEKLSFDFPSLSQIMSLATSLARKISSRAPTKKV